MDGLRLAQKGEFNEIMDFIDLVFRPGQAGRFILRRQYPHLFQNEPSFWRRITTVRDAGDLVGALAIHPVDLKLEDVKLRAGGIGQVATHPGRRGEGIMTTMLNDAIERMYQAGYPISILGGDRQRYGWFGWENGGVRHIYQVTPRSLGAASVAERKLPLKRLQMDESTLRNLRRSSLEYSYWAVRPQKEIWPLFKRNGREVWTCQTGRRFAYVVAKNSVGSTGLRIDEMGGDTELSASVLRVLMGRRQWPQVSVVTGPNTQQINVVRPYSAGWDRQCDCMIKIVNLSLLVEQLRPLLIKKARSVGVRGRYQFIMQGGDQRALLDLGSGKRRTISLDARNMVSLFFGIDPLTEILGHSNGVDKLAQILPLPLFVPPLNHI